MAAPRLEDVLAALPPSVKVTGRVAPGPQYDALRFQRNGAFDPDFQANVVPDVKVGPLDTISLRNLVGASLQYASQILDGAE